MTKRKAARGVVREKAPGVQKSNKPSKPVDVPPELTNEQKERIARFERYKHRVFVTEWLENGQNGTQAYLKAYPDASYETAMTNASQLLGSTKIRALIDSVQAEWKKLLNIDKTQLLRIQAAMATTTIDELSEVGKRPWDQSSYADLGDRRYAIECAEEGQHGNKVKLCNRQTAVNELWTKLGIKTEADSGRSESTARTVLRKLGLAGSDE